MDKILLLTLLLNGIWAGIDFPNSLRHDYKLSLKYPFNNSAIGYKVGGDVFFSEKFIRLAPSIPHKSGSLLSERKIEYDNVAIDVSFAVNGRGFIGGNGIGIWITNDLKIDSGNAYYGGNDVFRGIGIMLSTADKAANRKDPFIFGIRNDGTKKDKDFSDYMSTSSNILGGCFANYRNTPISHKLSVYTDMQNKGKGYIKCFEAKLDLGTQPVNGQRIGISANGLAIADDHDLYSIDVYQVDPPVKKGLDHQKSELTDEEKKKIEHFEHIVNEVEKENINSVYGDAVTFENVQHIMENQFHIMSQLETIMKKQKEGSSSSSGSSNMDIKSLEDKIQSLSNQVVNLMKKVDDLSNHVGKNANFISDNLDVVHEKIARTQDKIDEANRVTAHHFGASMNQNHNFLSWIKYTASIVGSAIIVYGLLAMVRKKDEPRKFI